MKVAIYYKFNTLDADNLNTSQIFSIIYLCFSKKLKADNIYFYDFFYLYPYILIKDILILSKW